MTTLECHKKGILDFLEEMMPGHLDLRNDFLAFMRKGDPKALHEWFLSLGFCVSQDECETLIENRNQVAGTATACAWY